MTVTSSPRSASSSARSVSNWAVASSSGQLKMESGDGKFHMEGKGFLWQQNEMTLILSNHVHTVLQMGVTNSFFKL